MLTLKLLDFKISPYLLPSLASSVASLSHLTELHFHIQPSEVSELCVYVAENGGLSKKNNINQNAGGASKTSSSVAGSSVTSERSQQPQTSETLKKQKEGL